MGRLRSISKPGKARLRVERSLFIGELFLVSGNREGAEVVSSTRKLYPDASHQPYAFRIVDSGDIVEYFTDDGEPPGTAGHTILEALRRDCLVNVLLVVTRYFGGKKLGTKRLRQSFAEVARTTTYNCEFIEVFIVRSVELQFPFDIMAAVERILRKSGGKIEEQRFGEDVKLKVGIPSERVASVVRHLEEVLKDRGEIRVLDEESLASS